MATASRLTGNWSTVRHTLQRAAHTGQAQLRQALLREGIRLANTIQENITQRGQLVGKPFAPNAPSTLRRKKSSSPLVHEGDLRNRVAAHRLTPDTVLVGIAGDAGRQHTPIGHYIAEYARVHEFGAVRTAANGTPVWIPPRPFIRPVIDYTRTQRQRAWKTDLQELFKR